MDRFCKELFHIFVADRLQDIVGAAKLEGFLYIEKIRMGGKKNTLEIIIVLTAPAQQGQTVFHRHFNVGYQNINRMVLDDLFGLGGIQGGKNLRDPQCFPADSCFEGRYYVGLVVNDHNGHLVFPPFRQG